MSILITFHINIVTRCGIDLQFHLDHIDASHLPDSIVLVRLASTNLIEARHLEVITHLSLHGQIDIKREESQNTSVQKPE